MTECWNALATRWTSPLRKPAAGSRRLIVDIPKTPRKVAHHFLNVFHDAEYIMCLPVPARL